MSLPPEKRLILRDLLQRTPSARHRSACQKLHVGRIGQPAVRRSDAERRAVATVAINGAQNAGILAAQMLALSDAALAKRLVAHRERMRLDVLETVLPQGKD